MRDLLTGLDAIRDLLPFLVPLVAGVVTEPIVMLLRRASAALDRAPSWAKQLLTVAIASALVALERALGVDLPDNPLGASPAELQALLAAVIAHILHRGKARDAARPEVTGDDEPQPPHLLYKP